MICLGWFSSHTRSEIALGESDLETYEKHFSAPWQVTLVIRPGRGGSMRAGFFVREHDGTVRSENSYLEFNFPDRLAGVLDRAPRGDRPERVASERRPVPFLREGSSSPIQRDPSSFGESLPGPQLLPAPAPRAKWPWMVAWLAVVVLLAGLGWRYFLAMPSVDPLALTLIEHDGQLQIQWNHSARPVVAAVRGTLVVRDGQTPRTIPLTPQDLEHGSYTYQRVSDNVDVRLSVESISGEKAEESSTFLGSTPGQSDAAEKAKAAEDKVREDLKAEVESLQEENAKQAAHIQELERNLKILQSRLGAQ
jgi:hypothetical protein